MGRTFTAGFVHDAPASRVVFGADAAQSHLVDELDRLGARRVMLITTERERARAQTVIAPLRDRLVAVFTDVQPHVPVEIAHQARELAADRAADAVLSIGGGSVTGTAKAVALTQTLPIIAVPTTYAGSEMTPVWGLTTASRKTTGRSPAVAPAVVVYDPTLTASMPPRVAAASGMNALAHALEAAWMPGVGPVARLAADEAVRALAPELPRVARGVADDAGHARVLYGAYLAATAFAAAGSGLQHKLCHLLGGVGDLPHAETHAVVLPHVVAFNESAVPDVLREAARALEADTAADGVAALAADLGVSRTLQALGLSEAGLARVVELARAADLGANPRPVEPDDAERLVRAAYAAPSP